MINNLLLFRTKNKLSQKDVAKAVQMSTSYYGMLEVGKRKPSLEVAHKLAMFYETTIEKIFFETRTT